MSDLELFAIGLLLVSSSISDISGWELEIYMGWLAAADRAGWLPGSPWGWPKEASAEA